jgi:hypothetical protein
MRGGEHLHVIEVDGVLAGVSVQRVVLESAGLDEARRLHVAQSALLESAEAAAHDDAAVLRSGRGRQQVLEALLVHGILSARASVRVVDAAGAQRVVHHEHAVLAGGLEVAGEGVLGRRPVGVEERVEEGLVLLHVRHEEASEHLKCQPLD